jgi:hypothetical protein
MRNLNKKLEAVEKTPILITNVMKELLGMINNRK